MVAAEQPVFASQGDGPDCVFTKVVVYLQLAVKVITSEFMVNVISCLLYTSPSPRDRTRSRMPSSA